MIVHPRRQDLLPIPGHGVGGHGDHRQVPEARVLPQAAGGGVAVHDRHLAIHEDAVEGRGGQPGQGLGAIVGHLDLDAVAHQQLPGQLLVDGIVLDQQHPDTGQGGPGLLGQGIALHGAAMAPLAGEGEDDGVEEGGGRGRLGEHPGDGQPGTGLQGLLPPMGGDHDHRGRMAHRRVRAQGAQGGDPVQARHAPVDEQELEGGALGLRRLDTRDGLRTGGGIRHQEAEALQHAPEHLACRLMVVHHQHPQLAQVRWQDQIGQGLLRLFAKAGGEVEGATHSRRALHADLAPHHRHQALADGQAQTRAAVAAGDGAVRLGEGAE